MLNWIRCSLGYRTPSGNFKIVYEIYDGYKLIHTRKTGQTMYLCDSIEDAKMMAEKIYREENVL